MLKVVFSLGVTRKHSQIEDWIPITSHFLQMEVVLLMSQERNSKRSFVVSTDEYKKSLEQ